MPMRVPVQRAGFPVRLSQGNNYPATSSHGEDLELCFHQHMEDRAISAGQSYTLRFPDTHIGACPHVFLTLRMELPRGADPGPLASTPSPLGDSRGVGNQQQKAFGREESKLQRMVWGYGTPALMYRWIPGGQALPLRIGNVCVHVLGWQWAVRGGPRLNRL